MDNNKTVKLTPTSDLGEVGKVVISKEITNKIDFLHRSIGNVEWSGVLIYEVDLGDEDAFSNIVVKASNLYPMDIGDAASTEFFYTPEDVVNMYDSIPEALEMNIGLIHSHHSMDSFISGTDLKELQNNAGLYNFYVSLVVSFNEKYVCRIVFPSKISISKNIVSLDHRGNSRAIEITEEEDLLLVGELDIEFESDSNLEEWFIEQVADMKRKKVERVKKVTASVYKNPYVATKTNNKTVYIDPNLRDYNNWDQDEFEPNDFSEFQAESNSFETMFPKVIDVEKEIVPVKLIPTEQFIQRCFSSVDYKEYVPMKDFFEDLGTFTKKDDDILLDFVEDAIEDALFEIYNISDVSLLTRKIETALRYIKYYKPEKGIETKGLNNCKRILTEFHRLYAELQ